MSAGGPKFTKWNEAKPETPEPGAVEPHAPGLRGATRVLFERELSLAWGGGGGPLLACAFFACLTAILPLAAGGDLKTLGPVAAGVAWLALALSSLLSLERLFERDLEDGALDLLATGHLPLALTAPVAALALGQPIHLAPLTALAAGLGGLGFAFTGALGAALALGAKRGGLLIAVVVLPLFIPPVVFGSGALARAVQGLSPGPALALLAAYALFAAVIAPFAGAAAIRNAQG